MPCHVRGGEEYHPQVSGSQQQTNKKRAVCQTEPYSLVKIDDDRLQTLLDEIQTLRKFQT